MNIEEKIKRGSFVGVVEDNTDRDKLGRCRIRIEGIYDGIPTQDLPFASPRKDLNGNTFNLPEIGKVVSVRFRDGDVKMPEYFFAEHYNINLENKLKNLSPEDYISMRALVFDEQTQIYSNDSEGLKFDYSYSNINLQSEKIDFNLRDNSGRLHLGDDIAGQQMLLGTNFINWFRTFLDSLLTGFVDNTGSPFIPAGVLNSYQEFYLLLGTEKILSKYVKVIDNNTIQPQIREYLNQKGDAWSATKVQNDKTVPPSQPPYIPKPPTPQEQADAVATKEEIKEIAKEEPIKTQTNPPLTDDPEKIVEEDPLDFRGKATRFIGMNNPAILRPNPNFKGQVGTQTDPNKGEVAVFENCICGVAALIYLLKTYFDKGQNSVFLISEPLRIDAAVVEPGSFVDTVTTYLLGLNSVKALPFTKNQILNLSDSIVNNQVGVDYVYIVQNNWDKIWTFYKNEYEV